MVPSEGKSVEMVLMSRIERKSFRCVPCGLVIFEGGADRKTASNGKALMGRKSHGN